jgi:uncharacterized protein
MKCPIDNSDLVMSERQGIEIDYCPKCRGVWLDRGELDKIIERSAAEEAPRAMRAEDRPPSRSDDRYGRPDQRPYDQQQRPYKKKKSFLGDIFDFD